MPFQEAYDTIPKGYESWQDSLDNVATTFEDSVFHAAGDDGLLSPGDARRLVQMHGCSWERYTEEQPDASRHPATLLSFLGY